MKKCPFCHSENIQLKQIAFIYPMFIVECRNCLAKGPRAETEEGAGEGWDAR